MRTLRLVSCLIVVMLCCSLLAPAAGAASTFTADLVRYKINNKVTSDDARELAVYSAAEVPFLRSLRKTAGQSPILVRAYRIALGQLESAVRRIVRDQRTSDRLLADVLALAGEKRTEVAWVLLKRGAAGQERFRATISRTRLLVDKCKALHAQLTRVGG